MLVVLPLEGFATPHVGHRDREEQQRDGDTQKVEHRVGLLSKRRFKGWSRTRLAATRGPPD